MVVMVVMVVVVVMGTVSMVMMQCIRLRGYMKGCLLNGMSFNSDLCGSFSACPAQRSRELLAHLGTVRLAVHGLHGGSEVPPAVPVLVCGVGPGSPAVARSRGAT